MPALFADEVSTDTLKSVEKGAAVPYDDTPRHSQHILTYRPRSLPADLGLSPNCLSSFGSIPGHEIINASVRFQGIVSVENHYQFRLLVSTGKVQFTLQKRYSHFREFRQQLLIIGNGDKHGRKCRNGACQQLMVRLTSMGFHGVNCAFC
ncbi:Phox homologous domain [Phytophthora cactorum]|nr:Phox homologous domain [Phytophthora cactorum]